LVFRETKLPRSPNIKLANEFTHFALQFLGEIISTEKTLLFCDVNILLRAYKVYVRPLVQRNFIIYICKKLISLKHCVRSQITRLKMQKSFCDLEHGASL